VFLAGVEYDPTALTEAVDSKELTAIPSHAIPALLDDVEGAPGRTQLGTLRLNATDAGIDHSPMLFHEVIRAGNDHSLRVQATMAAKERPYARLELPLTPGGIELADVSGYSGVEFEVRGEGAGRLIVQTYGVRALADPWSADFAIASDWAKVRLPFAKLTRREADRWSGKDARVLGFELSGPAGSGVWFELDNVRLY
jgi:hypothetical protein